MKKRLHATVPERISLRIMNQLNDCTRAARSMDKFVQAQAKKMKRYERQIDLLMTENRTLRQALKKPARKNVPTKLGFQFMFPAVTDSPVEILNRRIQEILPSDDNMDSAMRNARSRVIKLFSDFGHNSIAEMLRKNDAFLFGPKWEYVLRYRNFGRKSLSILAATFNHFKVDRKNLQPTAPNQ
jgi:hypothetical protein